MADYLGDDALNIYTDGSSLSSPRRGGIGIRFVVTGEGGKPEIHDYQEPGYRDSTNNEMEIWAAVVALRLARNRAFPIEVSRFRKVVIRTDSTYVERNYTNALYTWRQQAWTTRDGTPVENAELWDALVGEIFKTIPVEFVWVRGKSSDHTKAVDKLAKRSAQNALHGPLTPRRVRRKTSPNEVERGSVKMEGQRLDIRVITEKWSQPQRLHRLKYEVISADSAYSQKVDLIWSGMILAAGHRYTVVLGDEPNNPRIVEVVAEIPAEEE